MKESEEEAEKTTFTPDVSENCCLEKQVEIYQKEIVDEEDSELEEEEETTTPSTTTTTTTTTTAEPSTTSEYKRKLKRVKSKRPKTTPRTTTTSTTTEATTTEEITTTTEEEITELETQTPIVEEVTEPHFVCPVGAPIGECIANKCPEGHGCVEGQCCILTPQINCTDTLAGCLSHLCDRKGYRQFMTNNCAKTCARCHLVNITPSEIHDCRDRRSDCEEWAAEGFCESSLYTTRQKLKFCGKSCKLC
uniref:ShKT domain-containing protein n=1 Tax=Caenorhabditis tropicalis TaxID=1561998 RepID=A0A1I7U054_9PELO